MIVAEVEMVYDLQLRSESKCNFVEILVQQIKEVLCVPEERINPHEIHMDQS